MGSELLISAPIILVTAASRLATTSENVVDNVLNRRQFASFGPHLSIGQTSSEYIKMTTTFVPGKPPAEINGSLFIWAGLHGQHNRSEGDMIQIVVEFHKLQKMQLACNLYSYQW